MKTSSSSIQPKYRYMYPPDLYKMVRLIHKSHGEYGVSSAIKFLQDHRLDTVDALHNGYAKLNFVRWTEFFFSSMYPIKNTEHQWREHAEELLDLLILAECLLDDLSYTPNTSVRGNRTVEGHDHSLSDLVVIRQSFSCHFAILYWILGDEERFRRECMTMLEDQKANLTYVLHQENAERCLDADKEYPSGFYIHVTSYWRPLSWIYHEAFAMDSAGPVAASLIPVFEEYVEFLRNAEHGHNENSQALEILLHDAETQLLDLYERMNSSLEDEISLCEETKRGLYHSLSQFDERKEKHIHGEKTGEIYV